MITRRVALLSLSGLILSPTVVAAMGEHTKLLGVAIEVWKTPACGCCHLWVQHLNASGFRTRANDVSDVAPYQRKGRVPESLRSCHTALVGTYAIEGHVPADVIQQLLKQKPAVLGIAVPGMPIGSPGMEGPRKDSYEVISFDAQGRSKVFAIR